MCLLQYFLRYFSLSDIYFALQQHVFRATVVPLREALIPYFDNVSKSDLHSTTVLSSRTDLSSEPSSSCSIREDTKMIAHD